MSAEYNESSGYPFCPECGCDDGWYERGCMCGLEFFPPSEAFWAGSTMPLDRRIEILLDEYAPDELPRTASPIEQKFWAAHRKLHLTELEGLVWQAQWHPYWIDFGLPSCKIGIELDGFRNHSKTADVTRDHQRQRELEAAGWHIVRFGGSEVHHDAETCVRQAAYLVQRRRAGR